MDRFAPLLRDHHAINTLARQLRTLVRDDADTSALAGALRDLADTVAAHLAQEDALLYDIAITAQQGGVGDAAARARSDFERLKADWSGYLRTWQPEEIAADRSGFANTTEAILIRLDNRVQLENQLLSILSMSDREGPTSHAPRT